MNYVERPYRKNLESNGLIYIGGKERAVTIKNLSITGALAELNSKQGYENSRDIYNVLSASTMIGVDFPEIRLAGDAEVVRVDMDNDRTFIAMKFKHISHDVDDLLYKRKGYRKHMAAPGRILLNGEYEEFTIVNVSADGLIISLAKTITVEEGLITMFEFKRLELEGQIKVMWAKHTSDTGTLIGLQYVYIVNTAMDGGAVLI